MNTNAFAYLILFPGADRRPKDLGLVNGQLRPDPETPNCVNSQSDNPKYKIAPLRFEGDADTAWQRLQNVIKDDPKATLVTVTADYIHAEYRAGIFIDDVEFLKSAEEGVIHFRSASRIGRSDLGVNRRRMERVRGLFGA